MTATATLDGRQGPLAEPADVDAPDDSQTPPVPAMARPGWCSVHPGLQLVTPRRLGLRMDPRRQAVACPSPEHGPYDRDRCIYCGRALFMVGASLGMQGLRRLFETSTCRNYYWRWRRRQVTP